MPRLTPLAAISLLGVIAPALAQTAPPPCPQTGRFTAPPRPQSQAVPGGCTATFIADGRGSLLAPASCVEASGTVELDTGQSLTLTATVVARSDELGLAVLRASQVCSGGLALARQRPNDGAALAYLHRDAHGLTRYDVTARPSSSRPPGTIVVVETHGESFSGGAPLIDRDDAVVGLLTHYFTSQGQRSRLAGAIGLLPIRYALEEVQTTGAIRPPARLGLALQELTPELARAFGIAPQDGVMIAKVTPGSAAAAGDLRRQDIVMAVDGIRVAGLDAFFGLTAYRHPGDAARFEILRDDRRLSLSLRYPLAQ